MDREPDIDAALKRCRTIMKAYMDDDKEDHVIEIHLQHLAVELGRNPALVYPDYDERNGPEYWYRCPNNQDHRLVYQKSKKDWVCPICEL